MTQLKENDANDDEYYDEHTRLPVDRTHLEILPKVTIESDYDEPKQNLLSDKFIVMQIFFSIMANLSTLTSGMGLGFPAISLQSLQSSQNAAYLDSDQASWFASINMLTSPIGALLSSYVLDRFGRKKTLILINFTAIASWSIMALAHRTDSTFLFYQVFVARFIIGITTGLSSAPAAVYSAEIAHPTLRGRLVVITSFAIAFGILIIYTLGYFMPNDFRTISWIACTICIMSLFCLYFIPESPKWLIMTGRLEQAKLSLKKIRGISFKTKTGKAELNKEIELIQKQNDDRNTSPSNNIFKKLIEPEVYKPLSIMIGFFGFQQFSGIFVVIVYAVQFTQETGVGFDSFLIAVFIGITRIAATVVISLVLDKFGRKAPTIFSGIGMAVCLFGLVLISYLNLNLKWLPVTLIILYIFTSTIGFLTIPFAMIAEIYPQRVRGLTSGLTVSAAYAMSFIVVKLYPKMVINLGSEFVLIFYGVVSIAGCFYVWMFLPETKGKSLEEIEDYFRRKKKIHDIEMDKK